MARQKILAAVLLFVAIAISGAVTFGAAATESVTLGYSTFSGAYLPLWIAVEERLGRKYNLDLKAIY
ncbi:MAG TPA: hypothetical protein VNT76_16490, partial [Candidatus Binatus sp.]|nr:hypothetical protein [Candidatus Binatus sp.]